MASRLTNVRLDEARLRKVRRLRASGIALSDVVREAIDARHDALTRQASRRNAADIVRAILEAHPDPANLKARSYDVHDRAAARGAIRASLKRRRRS